MNEQTLIVYRYKYESPSAQMKDTDREMIFYELTRQAARALGSEISQRAYQREGSKVGRFWFDAEILRYGVPS